MVIYESQILVLALQLETKFLACCEYSLHILLVSVIWAFKLCEQFVKSWKLKHNNHSTFNQDVELKNDVVPKRNVGGLAYDYVIGEDSPLFSSSTRQPQLKISPLLPQEDTHTSQNSQKRYNQYGNSATTAPVPKRKVPIVETRTPAYFDLDVVPTTTQPYYYPIYYGENHV